MTYSILQLIDFMGDDFPLLLNSLLCRIPILVVGDDTELLDDLTESLTHLCQYRHRLVFWRDFTTEDELFMVWSEEKHDYEVDRTLVCSFSSSFDLVMERITHFMGWVISMPRSKIREGSSHADINEITAKLLANSPNCGVLRVLSPSSFEFSLAKGGVIKTAVEEQIISKILTRTHASLERIRRLLKKSLRNLKFSDSMLSSILSLDDEAEKITQDMFNEEINRFIHAARRAVTLLSRIRLTRELGAKTALSERNLCDAIGWDGGSLFELIRFIKSEWHEDFSDCVKGGSLSDLGAWVDSMWGV